MTAHRLDIPRTRRCIVRVLDLVVSLIALLLCTPVLLVIAIVIAVTSPGAPIYVHWRVSRGGGMFPCLKFRTMYLDAGARLTTLLATSPGLAAEWRRDQKLRDDPRVTATGRILRRTNLDELPQLLNVALGQMSIVGPRPIVVAEAARYAEKLPAVLSVRPGLTGLWQVSGRNNTTYERRTELDLQYVSTQSLTRDLMICAKTAHQMLRPYSNGAC